MAKRLWVAADVGFLVCGGLMASGAFMASRILDARDEAAREQAALEEAYAREMAAAAAVTADPATRFAEEVAQLIAAAEGAELELMQCQHGRFTSFQECVARAASATDQARRAAVDAAAAIGDPALSQAMTAWGNSLAQTACALRAEATWIGQQRLRASSNASTLDVLDRLSERDATSHRAALAACPDSPLGMPMIQAWIDARMSCGGIRRLRCTMQRIATEVRRGERPVLVPFTPPG